MGIGLSLGNANVQGIDELLQLESVQMQICAYLAVFGSQPR